MIYKTHNWTRKCDIFQKPEKKSEENILRIFKSDTLTCPVIGARKHGKEADQEASTPR